MNTSALASIDAVASSNSGILGLRRMAAMRQGSLTRYPRRLYRAWTLGRQQSALNRQDRGLARAHHLHACRRKVATPRDMVSRKESKFIVQKPLVQIDRQSLPLPSISTVPLLDSIMGSNKDRSVDFSEPDELTRARMVGDIHITQNNLAV